LKAGARLERLARAQRALARAALAERQAAEAAHDAQRSEAEAILGALGEGPLHGTMVPTMAAAVKRSGRSGERLRRAAEAAAEEAARQDATARTLEARARHARRAEDARSERRRLEILASTPPGRGR
jgi:hypothetical protein